MARFDVYRVDGEHYLDVQTNLLPSFGTRLVVPLVRSDLPIKPYRKLHPQFEISGHRLVLATHLMVSVPERSLGTPVISLRAHYDEIVAALDMIFLGF
jgi:toxin CcdB